MPRLVALAIPLMMLAGCGGNGSENETATQQAPEEDAQQTALDAMPEEFQGRWDFAVEDCDDPASEMKLDIEPNKVSYYESSADITAIRKTGPRSLAVEHHFSGEGEEWTETLGYELNGDGDRLTVSTPEGSLSIRMRCP